MHEKMCEHAGSITSGKGESGGGEKGARWFGHTELSEREKRRGEGLTAHEGGGDEAYAGRPGRESGDGMGDSCNVVVLEQDLNLPFF